MRGAEERVAVAVRFVGLAVLLLLSVLLERAMEVGPLVIVLGIAAVVSVPSLVMRRVRLDWLGVAEGAAVGVVAAWSAPHGCVLVAPYLAVPVFVAALRVRLAGPLLVLVAEALTGAAVLLRDHPVSAGTTLESVEGLALGLVLVAVGALVAGALGLLVGRSLRRREPDDSEASYRDAIALISQLDTLSDRLRSGLDPVELAEQVMTEAEVQLPVQQAMVCVRGPRDAITPLRFSAFSHPATFGHLDDLVEEAWRRGVPTRRDEFAAVPLRTAERTVAVLLLQLSQEAQTRALERLQTEVRGTALKLQAALLFDHVRNRATSEERNRLAREVHDGVAQDVASLGYLVDGLTSITQDDEQHARLVSLRNEITRVVAELRASVQDLRNEMRAGQGLGEGVSAFARQIGSRSDLTVNVRLDEGSVRLRSDVEAEMLRIAQEAMNNARKHSGGSNLWVSCTVRPSFAEIEVVDDGAGMGPGRPDSHGMRIMSERAASIGAELLVEPRGKHGPGTRLRVRIARSEGMVRVREESVSPARGVPPS